ncbi:ATP-binding protein [Acidocella sp.]|uniref:ATP-binding protein n=1 Tax=Acidocella sp. TaxID=50710 RepID=UPI00262940AE|nr:ATP-binding protein [Acidocella sp.]
MAECGGVAGADGPEGGAMIGAMGGMSAPVPGNEAARLAALRGLDILDTGPEEAFERLVELALAMFGVPAALVSLVDARRQWFKAVRGLAVTETPREVSFCAHAILDAGVCLVPDARQDVRFAGNPLVVDGPRIQFYAGAPLRTADGHVVGTLCLIDFKPRPEFGAVQSGLLTRLAAVAADELELRAQKRELKRLAEVARAAQREADEAAALKAAFAETMSHEIRTPLTGIIGMSEMLDSSGLRPDQAHYAATLKAASAHLLEIVNDVLDYSKLEAGALETEAQPCDLTNIVEEAVAVMAASAEEAGLALGAVFEAGVPRLVALDAVRLRQVLLNLIGNGVKFTNFGGVSVRVRRVGEVSAGRAEIGFEVRDTGIGIPEADQPRLFQRFTQLSARNARKAGGTGLGLAICHQLVRLLGGEIVVSSAPGKGSVFSFSLPVPLQPGAEAVCAAPLPLRGRRVLVAEPNGVAGALLAAQAMALGADALAVDDSSLVGASLGAARARGQPYDALLIAGEFAAQLELDGGLELGGQPFGPGLRVVRTRARGGAHKSEALRLPAGEAALLGALGAPREVRPPEKVSPSASLMPATGRLRILLAEDNEINQVVARAMLGSLGHELAVVQNGVEAISAVATGQYDLVLMDMMMPDIDGLTATRAIRKLRGREAGIYIIAVTANADARHRAQCLQAGMNDFLTKPLTRRALDEALARYAEARRVPGRAAPLAAVALPEGW